MSGFFTRGQYASWGEKDIILTQNKLYFVTDGKCDIILDGIKHTVKKNELVLMPAGVRHSYGYSGNMPLKKYWCHFEATAGSVDLFDIFKISPVVCVKQPQRLTVLFEMLCANGDSISDEIRKKGVLMQIIALLLEYSDYKTSGCFAGEYPELRAVSEYMREHLADGITVEDIAKMLHLHPNYCIRVFKQSFGYSPVRFFNNLRLDRAKQLLTGTNAPLCEIGKNIGCRDAYSFSKFFKSGVGVSPTKYRKMYGQK